jgi:peptidyl-dipeptidase A
MTNFERALYADPNGDLDALWWDLVERYQQVMRPDGRDAPDWAAKIHIVSAPVYYQNYLYGELVASQLQASFGGETALVDNPDVGRPLGDTIFKPGASLRWDHLVEHATGAPLNAKAFAAQLAG